MVFGIDLLIKKTKPTQEVAASITVAPASATAQPGNIITTGAGSLNTAHVASLIGNIDLGEPTLTGQAVAVASAEKNRGRIADVSTMLNQPTTPEKEDPSLVNEIINNNLTEVEKTVPGVDAISIPTNVSKNTSETVADTETAPEAGAQQEAAKFTASEELSGTALLNKFLPGIQQFLDLNKELAKAKDELETSKSESARKSEGRDTLVEDAKRMEDALQAMMLATEDEQIGTSLNGAITAFTDYQKELEKRMSQEQSSENSEINKILIKLNIVTANLKKNMESFGGPTNREEVIKTVKILKAIMNRYIERLGINDPKTAQFLVGKFFTNFSIAREEVMAADTDICIEFAKDNNIIGLLTLYVTRYVENEAKNKK